MSTKKSRREFLELSLKTGIILPFAGSLLFNCVSKNDKKLKILILGGTSFLGPHQIAYAIKRGHSVTTFTRGKTKPTIHTEIFKEVEQLTGDRNNDLSALENRKWDVVIDNSGRKTEWTKKSASLLKDNCDLYVYTSSTGVYYPYVNSSFKETSNVLNTVPKNATEEEKYNYDYGVMKVQSENEAIKQFGADRTIVVRPTYMIGPGDRTDRFMNWPLRLHKGGEILVPGKKEDAVQYIDIRDTAEWMIRLIEQKQTGVFNAAGPKTAQNIHEFVTEAQKAFNAETSFVKIDDYVFLKENNIFYMVPWIMPTEDYAGSSKINNSKALKNGLTFRPLKNTMQDTLNWWNSDAVSEERKTKFLSDEKSILVREKVIIEKWKARNS